MMKNDKQEQKERLVKGWNGTYENMGSTKEFLEAMAAQGWFLENVKGTQYSFYKDEPAKVVYNVELFVAGSMYDTHPTKEAEEYIDLCESAGWKYIASIGKIYIFMSTDLDVVPIETDAMTKYQEIRKTKLRGNLVNNVILIFIGVMNLITYLTLQRNMLFLMPSMLETMVVWIALLAIATYRFVEFGIWCHKAKQAVLNEEQIPERKLPKLWQAYGLLGCIGVLWSGISVYLGIRFHDNLAFIVPIIWIVILIILWLVMKLSYVATAAKIGRSANMALTLVVFPIIMCGIFNVIIIAYLFGNQEDSNQGMIAGNAVDKAAFCNQEDENLSIYRLSRGEFLLTLYCDDYVVKNAGGEEIANWDINFYYATHDKVFESVSRDAHTETFRNCSPYYPFEYSEKSQYKDLDFYMCEKPDGDSYSYYLEGNNMIATIRSDAKLEEKQLDYIYEKYFCNHGAL